MVVREILGDQTKLAGRCCVPILPAVRALEICLSGRVNLRWIVNNGVMPLLEGNPDIHEVIEFPRSQFRGIGGLSKPPPAASLGD